MSSALWDPANLLQISYETHIPDAPIFCVGESRSKLGNPRCRYTIPEPDYSRIRTTLLHLASKDPEDVEREALHTLAFLCLCDGYHKPQAKDVTDRWVRVVGQAAAQEQRKGHSRGSSSASVSDWWDPSAELLPRASNPQQGRGQVANLSKKLEEELAAVTVELKESKAKADQEIKSLRAELGSLQNLLAEAKERELESSTGASSMKGERDKLVEEMQKLRNELLEANEERQRLETTSSQLKEENTAFSEKLNQLRGDLVVATGRTQHLETECSRINEEMSAMRTEATELGEKNSVILNAIRTMEAERDAARNDHRKVANELAEQMRSYMALQHEVQSLQVIKAGHQQSNAVSWYRRLLTWISKFRIHAVLLLSLSIVELGRREMTR
ncbi:unnamed protein product [Clonostachys rhizophaga]|uniref:Uncharacterized protein n=1 Tax=Clonostachys rhizophaga TaxID=160324 RepID=A0A9N9VQ93_9HYPO|nr:unnamed protein product [Clonostachys rhizophaga]